MVLNGVNLKDEVISRFLRLSELPGDEHPSVKQQRFVSQSRASSKLPEWMYSSGVDYFDEASLIAENEGLAARLPIESPWLIGSELSGRYPGRVDPQDIILIAYNMLDEYSAAIFCDKGELKLLAMSRVDGIMCWTVVFDRFEDFLDCLGV